MFWVELTLCTCRDAGWPKPWITTPYPWSCGYTVGPWHLWFYTLTSTLVVKCSEQTPSELDVYRLFLPCHFSPNTTLEQLVPYRLAIVCILFESCPSNIHVPGSLRRGLVGCDEVTEGAVVLERINVGLRKQVSSCKSGLL